MAGQLDLFRPGKPLPDGFRYQPDLLSEAMERELAARLSLLPFKEFDFRGFLGKRRVVSYGWRYDFKLGKLLRADDIPEFLSPARAAAARFAGLATSELQQALVTEYPPGAAIGWHRDRPMFDEVVGISLLSSCTFRFRRKSGPGWQRVALALEPRSAYLLQGASRTEWEHSIPGVERLRYSITFRRFKA
ncbi:MAG TPA: alpha-ketoglutarate-dependent dioxygenase AlkB [Xanthobacteraceae bacterium]|nr:alpha-ketoglutarate-dependent dioxygenase AlkB [Xanthobacteraceae bacterium]